MIMLLSAAFKVPVVVSPILILFVKLATLASTSDNSFKLLAPAYSAVATPPDVYAPKPVLSRVVVNSGSVYNEKVVPVKMFM